MKTITVVLAVVSVLASAYYLFAGMTEPESMAVYSRANIPPWGIRASAALLGAAGMLLLFPTTFRLATLLMVIHSLFTVACFVIADDWRGASTESVLLLIPVYLFRVGYPMFALEKVVSFVWN
jgi:hypothetical protein